MKTNLGYALFALLTPALASAANCDVSQDRSLKLDFAGVTGVRFEVNANELHLSGAGEAAPSFSARACASTQKALDHLVLSQHREGGLLVIRTGKDSVNLFGSTQGYLEIHAVLPTQLPYEVVVGSGDAWITDLKMVTVEVGSGDVEARNIFGTLDAKVGSGDLSADSIGQLKVRAVSSGNLDAIRVTGDVSIGRIGSGDVSIKGVAGNVDIDSIGSGDADVEDVSGDLRVASIGSGDVSRKGIRGRTDVPSDD